MPGDTSSPFVKRSEQSFHFGITTQSDSSHSVDQAHAGAFLPKLIMMSSEHHVVTSQKCKGFLMMTFTLALKGY